ncbi:hypothetical protein [Halomonas faecis]|uniref:hypothetical protein n=1 Tax=Halomonas faecis TaxID=1562110 RepID=UPI0013D3E5A1|nr:hypothetical protein [Halomonas faecis]
MKTIEAIAHHDATSGKTWLALEKPIVRGLGIENVISRRSLVDRERIYLAEGADTKLVKLVLEEKVAELVITEVHHDDDDWSARLQAYSQPLLGDVVVMLEDKLLEAPRADQLDAESIRDFADRLHDRALRYCRVQLPEHEWVSNLLEFKDAGEEAWAMSQFASHSNTVGMMTEARRGNNEGYICTAYLTRYMKGGVVAVPLVNAKFWSWDQAEQLSRKIQDWVNG